MIDRFDALERLRQPGYTGENRCLPCTVVNVGIALAIAVGLGAASPLVGATAFACCLAIVALRGYLIPGTPTLTRRYLPERALRAFGKEPRDRPTIETADLEDALETLTSAGVVVRNESATEPARLAPRFRARWNEGLERFATDAADLEARNEPEADREWSPPDAADVAQLVGLEVDDVRRRGETTFELEGSRRRRWASAAALAADVAADRELRALLEGWAALDADDRQDVLTGLRLLRDRCPVPTCDGRLAVRSERLEHCCRRPQVGLEATCEACGRPAVTVAVPEDDPLLAWTPASSPANRDAADAD